MQTFGKLTGPYKAVGKMTNQPEQSISQRRRFRRPSQDLQSSRGALMQSSVHPREKYNFSILELAFGRR